MGMGVDVECAQVGTSIAGVIRARNYYRYHLGIVGTRRSNDSVGDMVFVRFGVIAKEKRTKNEIHKYTPFKSCLLRRRRSDESNLFDSMLRHGHYHTQSAVRFDQSIQCALVSPS